MAINKINFDGTEIEIPRKTSQLENDSGFTDKEYIDERLNGANKAVSFINYSSMIASLNTLAGDSYNVGQNIMIVTLQVPDLWVSEILAESVVYTYVSDDDFVNELLGNGGVQVGYFKLSALETQKVDLTDYVKFTDYATNRTAGVVMTNSTYGFGVLPDNGLIYLSRASDAEILAKTQQYRAIVPQNLDYAVKIGVTTNVNTLTDEEKSNAQQWLGIDTLVEDSSVKFRNFI